jgi:hypothetical protein
LARLDHRNQVLQERVRRSSEAGSPSPSEMLLGPDLIGDFHRLVIAELRNWADEAAQELGRLRGRHLAERRVALRKLREEIRVLCDEIAAREAIWTAMAHPEESPQEPGVEDLATGQAAARAALAGASP